VIYHDGQFDDARLAICLAQTAAELGATPLNYLKVTSLLKAKGLICGVAACDEESGREYELKARVVINATGVFADCVREMDEPGVDRIVAPSQGVHLVFDKSFLPGDSAIMVPHTDDGRVLFAIPWHGRALVGTTDTPVEEVLLEPKPFEEEIDFILTHAARYLTKDPKPGDILSAFAGLRPLVKTGSAKETASLSRDHTLMISSSGLLTVAGGKWTTYRKMGQDTVDCAAAVAGLQARPSTSKNLHIHGWLESPEGKSDWQVYGSDALALRELIGESAEYGERLHPNLPFCAGEVVWAVRHEMARRVEDVLSRRTRALLLDAKASMEIAPKVAQLMARELGRDEDWVNAEVATYLELARGYSRA